MERPGIKPKESSDKSNRIADIIRTIREIAGATGEASYYGEGLNVFPQAKTPNYNEEPSHDAN